MLNRLVLLAFSTCSVLVARSTEGPAKPPSVYPNNGIASVLYRADLAQKHCVVNLNGDWSARYSASAPVQKPQAHVNPEAQISQGSPKEREVFVLGKKVYKSVKTDEAEPVTTTRPGVYSEAYSDYRGKVVVVVIPKKGTARAYRRRIDESFRDAGLRELDGLLMDFCGKESH